MKASSIPLCVNLSLFLPAPKRVAILAFLGLLTTSFFLTLDTTDLIHSHEARAAQNAQRMLLSGDWALPRLFDNRLDLQKPPAYYWAVALFSRCLTGGRVSAWTARLPAALSGLATLLLVYLFVYKQGRPRAAAIAAIVLASALHFTATARIARIDVPLTASIAAAVFAFYLGCSAGQCGRSGRALFWHLVAGGCAGIAMLLKGPVGPALVAAAAGAWWLWQRPVASLRFCLAIACAATAVALPWCLWANHVTEGEWFRVFILHHTLARYAGTSPLLATHPWWFYFPRFCFDFLPWSPLFIVAVVYAYRTHLWREDPLLRLAAAGFAAVFLLLSSAQFKRADYLLPAYPFAAMFIGCTVERWLKDQPPLLQSRMRLVFHGLWTLMLCGWSYQIGWVEPRRQQGENRAAFAALVRLHAPPPCSVIQFRMESHLLTFRLGMPVETLVEWGDLRLRLGEPGPHFVVMPREYVYPATQIIPEYRWHIVGSSGSGNRHRDEPEYVFLRVD